MTFQPNSAGDTERDLIESMLERQTVVLSELDLLFQQIEDVISDISHQRKAEINAETEKPHLEFPAAISNDQPLKRAA